ncbi:MAG: excinuclease ABC subunit UvrA [Verrucomicrobia bacterium]|nr:MAG: excinuclease ABC subunit UvrA [Verrucomicrobiota bacterium]
MARDRIRIGGARVHNLKNVSLELPRDRLIVITGPSGSGKSSLAFDTLFAEGQRKYMESLSAFARQFLDQLEKPDVDFIDGLSPAIAIEQRTAAGNPRSLIATTTEIYDYLRLLYAHVGRPHCPQSGVPMTALTPDQIVDRILGLPGGSRVMVLAPVVRGQRGAFRDVLSRLAREGFVRVRVDGRMYELGPNLQIPLAADQEHHIEVVVDRLVVDPATRARLADSVETALRWGEGLLLLLHQPPSPDDPRRWQQWLLSTRLYSPATGLTYERPGPRHFSFNSPQGACPACQGLGTQPAFDEALVVPDPDKSLAEGAIAPWRRGGRVLVQQRQRILETLAREFGVSVDAPFRNLPEEFRRLLLYGSGGRKVPLPSARGDRVVLRPFEGVLPSLERLYHESESQQTRGRLKAFMAPRPCAACQGRRLRPEILAVTLGGEEASRRFPVRRQSANEPVIPGLSIMDVCALSIENACRFFDGLELTETERRIAGDLVHEIRQRLEFLRRVGLGYLSLDRESGSLSGGEAQRIRLATQIGSGLVGVLYILDEPSIGLHQRDNERLLQTLEELRDRGNTVVVVEHDEETIRRADYIVDLGPGAGAHGGEVVAAGTLEQIMAEPRSLTGRYLSGELTVPRPDRNGPPPGEAGWLEIVGAAENNLKDIDVRIPLGTLTCVTGVSGSGKSTLVDDILRRALARRLTGASEIPGKHRELRGIEHLSRMVVIDQSPIGRTPRSNPATYTGIFHLIRDLFARLPAARIRGYTASRFSFNVRGGRCERCNGDGLLRIEMNFLPPVYVTCEACQGRRYNRETLEITYKGRNIADVLELTVDEAVTFFRAVPAIHEACLTLAEVGLGYLQLGQPATTLSGGEAQRLKIATELSKRSPGHTLYLLDEPTTGLHFADVTTLLDVLYRLRAAGNTLVVIEHNLDVIRCADWIIDLGPEGGDGGGRIVVEGPPEEVARCEASHTGRYLRRVLERKG